MAMASIPVDLVNPGQVFACLGFLEAADALIGDTAGKFDWSDRAIPKFCLRTAEDINPFETVLKFLVEAKINAVAPNSWRPKQDPDDEKRALEESLREAQECRDKDQDKIDRLEKKIRTAQSKLNKLEEELICQKQLGTFPAVKPDTSSAMPIQIANNNKQIVLSHWCDGSDCNEFKLYSGNRSACDIAATMVKGTHKTKGVAQLWKDDRTRTMLIGQPFDVTTPMSGSFNFDARGAWTALDAGYSPNEQKHQIKASPVVEILAAWGLENARPEEFETRKVRYAAWGDELPPVLARAALAGAFDIVPLRRFRFSLELSGKNKIVTFAKEETAHD